mgnify:CR=1 FL=1
MSENRYPGRTSVRLAEASWLAPILQQQLGRTAPRELRAAAFDVRVLIGAFGAGIVTTVICALAPLVTLVRLRLVGALQGEGRTATDSVG